MLTRRVCTIIFQIENNWQNAEMRLHSYIVYQPPFLSGFAQRSVSLPTLTL